VLLTLRLKSRGWRDQPWRFDGLGLVLFNHVYRTAVAGARSGAAHAASLLPPIAALSVISLIALIALIRQQRRVSDPLLPITLLRNPTVWRSDALAAATAPPSYRSSPFSPLYFRVTARGDPGRHGLMLLPLVFGIGAGSMLTAASSAAPAITTMFFPTVGLVLACSTLALFRHHGRQPEPGRAALALLVCLRSLHGYGDGRRAGYRAERRRRHLARHRPWPPCSSQRSVWRQRRHRAGRHGVVCPPLRWPIPRPAACSRRWWRTGKARTPPSPARPTCYAQLARAFRAAFLTIAAFAAAGRCWPGRSLPGA
jgi:hypothetical protein